MANKVGTLIKKARTDAGLSQADLAKKVKTVTAADISKAERGEKELTDEQLKSIAKITGVTQKSLLEAAASSKYTKSSSTSKTAARTSTAKKTSTTGTSVKLTAAEKAIIELYRAADADTKKRVKSILKGEETGLGSLITSLTGASEGKKESKKEQNGLLQTIIQNAAKDMLK